MTPLGSQSQLNPGVTLLQRVQGSCAEVSLSRQFTGLRYLRLVYLCGKRKNRIIPGKGKVFAEDMACLLSC